MSVILCLGIVSQSPACAVVSVSVPWYCKSQARYQGQGKSGTGTGISRVKAGRGPGFLG